MKLFHGSRVRFDKIKRSQAQKGEHFDVPESELQNGIYLTPIYEFALAIGAQPEGAAIINNETHKIEFQKLEKFDPEMPVYIYVIDSDKIQKELLQKIDDEQYVITELDSIVPDEIRETTAGEVFKFYKIKNLELPENTELKRGLK